MLNVFSNDLARRLQALPLAAEVRADLLDQSGALLNVRIPSELSDTTQAQVRTAIRESFIAGFRLVAYVAAALAAVSALVSWLMIAGKADDPGNARPTNIHRHHGLIAEVRRICLDHAHSTQRVQFNDSSRNGIERLGA
jgi:hypothetical protein